MKTLYTRTLALIMAVVLCFSMVPMAAFATEIEPPESEVSSALEEPMEEELPPEDDASSIVEEILPEDIPVVYARDPITKVKADLEGGSSYLTNYGVTRAAIVNELESHRNDSYYLGTPYVGGDVQSPNGDTSYNGSAGLNCGGFVGYVLRKVGLNCSAAIELMKSTGDDLWFGSGKPYDLLAGASNYYQLAKAAGLTCYVYNTKAEMLADGKCEKGDIILMYWSLQPFSDGADNHIGFFWGESSGDDVLWHSSTEPGSGNQISAITPKAANAIYILIKIEPTGYNVTLTKTSADASYTQGNNSYSLAGATYAVYTTSDATGTPVATFTTDENGHAELAKPLGNGTYTVKETKAPKGYKLDENIYTFHINGSDTSVDVQDDPGRVRLKLVKRDPKTGEIAQGNASLAGAVYQITYQKGGQTVTLEGTSDAQGHIEPVFKDIPFGKVTVREIKAPEGYKLDTTPHTYDIGAPDVVTDVYEMEPTDITDEVIRGGVTIEKRDSVTGDKPQGDASFAGIKFDIINKSTNAVEVNGKNCAPGSVVMTITTDNNGMATTGPNTLPYGDYVIKESATNNSMLQTFTEEIPVTVDEDGKIYPFTAKNDVVRGGISIEKRDSKTGQTPQGNADFSGITFEIVNRSANPVVVDGLDYAPGAVVATMTTDSEGKASTADDALPFGRYEVRESATNESMLLTFQSQTVTVSENKKVYPVVAENDVVRGGLSLEKHDSITGSTPQGDTGFEGITFQIINKSRNPVIVNGNSYALDEVVLELVTDAEGKASTANDALPFGEYLLHESATNESMLNTAPDQQVVISEHHKVYPFVAENEVVRGGVLIEKRDLESGLLTPLGGASLDGTLFEITNKSKNAVYVDGALYDPDTVCLTIEVKDGIAQSDVRALPYGTYTLAESKPGTGYLWTDKKVRDFTVRSDGEVTEYREGNAAYNQVKRGDLRFVKVGEDNMHRFGNVAFKLTSQTTGESHILITDANGEVRTETAWNPHTQNTNGNDDTEDWNDLTGIWFGQTTEGWMVETQDGLCALPYDHYRLEELRCPGNEGYELVTVPNIFISRDNTVIELGTPKQRFDAGHTDLVYWLRSRGEKLKKSGSEWEWKYQDERVTIRGHLWFDQYTQEGGDAVKFLQYFYGFSEEDAVVAHLDSSSVMLKSYTNRTISKTPKSEIILSPPAVNHNMRRVFAYLCQTRGIDSEIVSAFAHERLLYESVDKHNAVFVGRNNQGAIRHIHMRSTLTDSHFRQTLAGSDKSYSFHYTGSGKQLYVFEAPIDLLSYISLHPGNWRENSYVALCGVGIAPIERFLDEVPQLEEVTLCLDNDEAGHKAALRIARQLLDEWEVSVTAHFPDFKDWNEELLAMEQEEEMLCSMTM